MFKKNKKIKIKKPPIPLPYGRLSKFGHQRCPPPLALPLPSPRSTFPPPRPPPAPTPLLLLLPPLLPLLPLVLLKGGELHARLLRPPSGLNVSPALVHGDNNADDAQYGSSNTPYGSNYFETVDTHVFAVAAAVAAIIVSIFVVVIGSGGGNT